MLEIYIRLLFKSCLPDHYYSLSLFNIYSSYLKTTPESEKLQQLSRFFLSQGLGVFSAFSVLAGFKASVFCLDFETLAFFYPWLCFSSWHGIQNMWFFNSGYQGLTDWTSVSAVFYASESQKKLKGCKYSEDSWETWTKESWRPVEHI